MNLLLTSMQARRAQRLARQHNPQVTLVQKARFVSDGMPLSSEVVNEVVRPALESLGVVFPNEPLHLRVFRKGVTVRCENVVLHRTTWEVPAGSVNQLVPSDIEISVQLHNAEVQLFVDGPSLSVLQIIQETIGKTKPKTLPRKIEPFAKGLALASELCGVFSRDPFAPDHKDCLYNIEPVLTQEEFTAFAVQINGATGLGALKEVAEYLSDRHGSPMEVMVYALAVTRTGLGGLALSRPVINQPLDLKPRDLARISHKQLTPDLYWKKYQVVSEYDGKVHESPSAIKEDKRRVVDYQALGITVFPATSDNFKDTESSDAYMRSLARHMEKQDGAALTRRMNRLFADEGHRARRTLLRTSILRCA